MNKLTVCLLSDAFPPIIDGVSHVVANYAEHIEKEWGHAIVATPAHPDADDSALPFPVVRYASIDTRGPTAGYMAGIPFSMGLINQLSRQRVDVLHAHSPMSSALLVRALHKRVQAPSIMTYHTRYDVDIANVIQSKALQQSSIKSIVTNISAFDEVWAVSTGAGENLRANGYQGDYIVMPNGVDFERQKADPLQVAKDTGSYDLPSDVPVFLFVGRLMWYKGIRIILDALKTLQDEGYDFRMVFVGTGGDEEEIKDYTRKLKLDKKVVFTGLIRERNTLRSWYTRGDLFLLPSTFDSNPLVVREAAACDLASVLIAGSSSSEGAVDGHNAYLIEENAQSMAQLLRRLLNDPDHMKQTGEHAGEELYLSWENAVIKAVERYRIVMELHKSGAYKEHRSFSDNLLATQGDMMYTVTRIGRLLSKGSNNTRKSYKAGKQKQKRVPKKAQRD